MTEWVFSNRDYTIVSSCLTFSSFLIHSILGLFRVCHLPCLDIIQALERCTHAVVASDTSKTLGFSSHDSRGRTIAYSAVAVQRRRWKGVKEEQVKKNHRFRHKSKIPEIKMEWHWLSARQQTRKSAKIDWCRLMLLILSMGPCTKDVHPKRGFRDIGWKWTWGGGSGRMDVHFSEPSKI